MAKRYVPYISHVNCHMGCEGCAPEIADLVKRLAIEYKLDIQPSEKGYRGIRLWTGSDTTAQQRIAAAVNTIKNLKPGKYLFVEHPGLDTPEMQAIGHTGYEKVAADRNAVTKVFTSPEVSEAIKKSGIRLVSYKDTSFE
jgi:hypothetical protein